VPKCAYNDMENLQIDLNSVGEWAFENGMILQLKVRPFVSRKPE
jgi:hypothetical protein